VDRRPLGPAELSSSYSNRVASILLPGVAGMRHTIRTIWVVNKVPEDKHNESQQLESDGSSVDEFPLVSGLIHSCRNSYQNPNDPDDHSPGDVANRSGQGVDLLCDCHPCHVESSDGEDPQDAEE
jgi:hypothetical protein